MARINKNGNISGAVGKLVFYELNGKPCVREKPGKINQSQNTKKSASQFGKISSVDKMFREAIQNKLGFESLGSFPARHRGRLGDTRTEVPGSDGKKEFLFQNPQPLVGLDFNAQLTWQKTSNFYPDFTCSENSEVSVQIPEIAWRKQIKAPKNATEATLSLYAFTINPNREIMEAEVLSAFTAEISSTKISASQNWNFTIPGNAYWVFVFAKINFTSNKNNLDKYERETATYLWAKHNALHEN